MRQAHQVTVEAAAAVQGRRGAAGSGCSERPRHHSSITLSYPGRLKNARNPAQSGGGLRQSDRTEPMLRTLVARHCRLWPAICPALLPGSCTRGAGAGLAWWRRARAVPTPGLSSHLAARLRFPRRVRRGSGPVGAGATPTSRSGCTPRRSTGGASGGWKDSPPGRQGGDHDVVYVRMRKAMRATVVVEGGDHPALGLDRREPAEARVLQELERRIVS